jgi:hypothetical protein
MGGGQPSQSVANFSQGQRSDQEAEANRFNAVAVPNAHESIRWATSSGKSDWTQCPPGRR